MTKALISYATKEGQTARIVSALADQLKALGHSCTVINLDKRDDWRDPSGYDAVIVAASVHAGKHQAAVARFVTTYRDALKQRITAFLSVSMAAASTEEAGLLKANEQAESFFAEADWRPDEVELVAGAFRFSRFSRLWRWIISAANKLAKKDLSQLGWPDLTRDQEFTDWVALRGFGKRLAARL